MCKDVYKINMQMNYEEAYWYASAKSDQATLLQQGGWIKGEGGMGGFLKGNYRPGLGTADAAKKLERDAPRSTPACIRRSVLPVRCPRSPPIRLSR